MWRHCGHPSVVPYFLRVCIVIFKRLGLLTMSSLTLACFSTGSPRGIGSASTGLRVHHGEMLTAFKISGSQRSSMGRLCIALVFRMSPFVSRTRYELESL